MIRKLALLTLPFGATAAFGADNDTCRRPNIVFAFGDDYGRYASAYARADGDDGFSSLISTPNFDRVAGEGVLFTNAYAPAPTSTACRSSLMSGQYFWRTGLAAFLRGKWDESIPSFPLILEADGYHVGFTYKAWGPGFEENQPIGGTRTEYVGHGDLWDYFSIAVSEAGDNKDAAHHALLEEVRGNFCDFLAAREDGKPFFYWWGPRNTHRPWAQGSGKELWGLDPDRLEGRMPDYLPDVPEIREDFADYLGECLAFDEGLGVLLEVLEERGELENTIIVVSGDHGIPGFPRAKANLYDLGTRVALAVRWPAGIAGGRVVTDFVSLMDLAPTFLDYGESEIPDVMNGRSIRPLLESCRSGRVDNSRDCVVVGRERHNPTARPGNLSYPSRAVITDRYKYIRNFEPARFPVGSVKDGLLDMDAGPTRKWFKNHLLDARYEREVNLGFGLRPYDELYDLRNDPDEMDNLAGNPRYRHVLKKLSSRLDRILLDGADPRMAPDVCIFESEEFCNWNPKGTRGKSLVNYRKKLDAATTTPFR